MVTVVLAKGDTLRLNLRDKEREKSFRDAWYAMSDTPRFRDKELKVTTDIGKVYNFKVGEIKSCVFEDKMFDRSVPELQPAPAKTEPDFKDLVFTAPPELGENVDLRDVMRRIVEAISEILRDVPAKYKNNMLIFMNGLQQSGIRLNPSDTRLFDIAEEAFKAESPVEILALIKKYRQMLSSDL